MNTFNNRPGVIKRIHGKGFVDYTITRRLPKILSTIEKQLQEHRQLEAAQSMLQSVIAGSPIDTKIFSHPTAYWKDYLDKLSGLTWNDLSFFDLEFLFYHGLNSIAGYFDSGLDVFWPTRQRALSEAMPVLDSGLAKILELSGVDLLRATIRCSLFANEADYSQLITSRSDSTLWNDRVLLDESTAFITCLEQHSGQGDIHIIADNAGHELCWDLVMVDALLRVFNTIRVIIHVNPWPMFVSDALSIDVEETLNRFISENRSESICLVGQRLRTAIDCDRLQIQAEVDWGEPRHFNALDKTLGNTLSNSIGVISKGDLNYRRFVQDRQWPMDTPVEIATSGVPFKALALRVLKSDALVGIDPSISATAAATFDDWRTRGYFAVVQPL